MTKSLPEIRRLRAKGHDVGELATPQRWSGVHDLPWAADNDAFQGFEPGPWLKMLGALAGRSGCLFVVAPDAVGDARLTRQMYERYQPVITDCDFPVAYVLQDGVEDVGVPWDEYLDAIFIGGSTGFKFSAVVAHTVAEAKERGIWVHMGRVNTVRRIQYAGAIGCDSIDGTNWSRFTDRWVHQLVALQHRQELLKAPEFARIESEKR